MEMQEILTALLKEVEQNPKSTIEDLLISKAEEYGLSDEEKSMLQETFAIIDKIDSEHQTLKEIREEGGTRSSYISQSVARFAQDKSDEQLQEVSKAISQMANSQLSNH